VLRAAAAGKTETVLYLLSQGGDVNVKDKNGNTPLHWATINGYTETVTVLLTHGARVNAHDTAVCTLNFSSHASVMN